MEKYPSNLERIQKSCEAVVLRIRNKRRGHRGDIRAHVPYIAIVVASVIFISVCCGALAGERVTDRRPQLRIPRY